jgi:hypothetical protein
LVVAFTLVRFACADGVGNHGASWERAGTIFGAGDECGIVYHARSFLSQNLVTR